MTIEVPTLLPMLRMKFTRPDTLLPFWAWNPDVGAQIDRHKEEAQTKRLHHPEPAGGPETDLQIQTLW